MVHIWKLAQKKLHKTVSSYSMLTIKKEALPTRAVVSLYIYIYNFFSHLFPAAGVPVNLFYTVAFCHSQSMFTVK